MLKRQAFPSKLASAALIVVGVLVLAGWAFNIPFLKSLLPTFATMKPNTASGFVLIGVALWMLLEEQAPLRKRQIALLCASVVLLLGTLTVCEYVFGWNLGIDELLFKDPTSAANPGRMAAATAISFSLLGLSLSLLALSARYWLMQALTLIVLCVALVALLGYLYGVTALYGVFAYTSVAVHTAIALVLASAAVLLARPQHGLMAVISADSPGGLMARRLLPAVFIVPCVVGWLRLKGQQQGLYGTEFGLALFAVSNILIFAVLIWWNARALNHSEARVRSLNRTLTVLSDVNQAIVRTRDLPALFGEICQIAVEKGGFRMAWIGLLDTETGQVKPVAHAGVTGDYLEKIDLNLLHGQNPFARSLRAGEPIIINNLEYDLRTKESNGAALRLGYRALARFPLKIAGEVRGTISLYSSEPDFFGADETKLLNEMADDVAFAMEYAERDRQREQAEAAVKRYAQRMEILHQIDRGIINATSIQQIVDTALKHIREIINCQQIGVALFDFTTNELNFFALDLNAPSMLATGNRYPIPPGYLDEFGANTVRVIDDLQLLPDANPTYTRLIQEGIRSSLRVLLMFQGQPIGVFGLNADTPGFFTAEHQEITAEIANQIAIAVKQLRLSEELARHTAELEQRVVERTADLQGALVRVEGILNNSPDGILLAHSDLTIKQANSAFNHLFGAEVDEYFGQPLVALLHPDDANAVGDFHQIAARQHGRPMEVRAIRKDGTTFDAELNIGVIKGDVLVCIVRDITERKAQERQLRYYASIQESVSDAVIATDMDFRVQSWNRAAEMIYGWSAGETIGKPANEILQTAYESEADRARILQDFLERGAWQGEVIQRRRDGRTLHVHASVNLFKDEVGKPFGIVSVNRDITERKQAEEALRQSQQMLSNVIENIPVRLFWKDRNSVYQGCNTLHARSNGLARPDEIIGKTDFDFFPERAAAWDAADREVMVSDIPKINIEELYTDVDGSSRWLRSNKVPLRSPNGDITGVLVTIEDITERKRAEGALIESEERFRQIAENIDQILFIRSGDDQNMLYISSRYESLWGQTPASLYEHPDSFIDPVHPDDLAYVGQQLVAKRYVEEGFADFEYRILSADQRLHWVRTRTFPIKDSDGAIVRRAGIIEDITERKQAEEALRESEENFRLLLDAAPVATIITDQTGRITLINLQAEALFGYERAEAIGQRVEILVPEHAREKHVHNRAGYLAAPRVREMGIGMELFARRKDSSEFPVEIQLSFIETTAGMAVISFVVDITERKQLAAEMERQRTFLRQVIDVSPNMISVKDYNSRFVFVNPMVAKLYNTTVEAIIGKTDADLNPRFTEGKAFLEADRQVITTGEPLFIEESVTSPMGETRWLQTVKVPIRSADGKSTNVLGVSTDITERRKSEETLRQAFKKEKELGELKSRFVSMASHEFRTPLATILALTETLMAYRHKLPEEQIEQRLGKIQDQIAHLKDIMEDVLLLARMQARRVEFNPVTFNLDSLCRSVIDEFQSRPDVGQRFHYRCDERLHEVKLDKKLMRQLVNNLVSNAVKYSPPDKPITVTLVCESDSLILTVQDEGIGIPEADIKHLFEPFHRATNVGSISGTGLGMVITKEAVELHGGTISVESAVGTGTTFTVSIPLNQVEKNHHDENSGH